jgi:alcohol dehydrogenase (NADP+)
MKRDNEPNLFEDPAITELASKHDLGPAQVMLAWAVNRGSIPIPKSSNAERQTQNLEAAKVELTADEMDALASLDRKFRYVDGTFWEVEGGPYTVASLWDE